MTWSSFLIFSFIPGVSNWICASNSFLSKLYRFPFLLFELEVLYNGFTNDFLYFTFSLSFALINKFQIIFFFFKDFIYLFLEREEGREKEKERYIGCLLHAPHWGPGPQRRYVPWLGIKLATFWFTGQHSITWATPARAQNNFLKTILQTLCSCIRKLSTTCDSHMV